MNDLTYVLMGCLVALLFANAIVIKIHKSRSIDLMGPAVQSRLSEPLLAQLGMRGDEEKMVVFFDFNCITCKEVITKLVKENQTDDRLHFVSSGTEEQLARFREDTGLTANITLLPENLIKKQLKITIYPFVIEMKDGLVTGKEIASYESISSYLDKENGKVPSK